MAKLNSNKTLIIDDSELDDDYDNPFEGEEITTEKQERLMKLVEEINKKYFYPAIFSKEGDAYNVKFIDFDNIFTFGIGFEDAYYMAQDALYNMLPEYGDNLPEPTLDYMNIKVNDNEFVSMVELDLLEHEKKISNKTVKTTVTMPEWLKELADKKGLNFSKLLQDSIKNELNLL